ncbi:hypothetical protein BDV11DRAFT_191265 [Aspergillus similis]
MRLFHALLDHYCMILDTKLLSGTSTPLPASSAVPETGPIDDSLPSALAFVILPR